MTVHVVATRDDGAVWEATLEHGQYLIVDHGSPALPEPAQLRTLGERVALTVKGARA